MVGSFHGRPSIADFCLTNFANHPKARVPSLHNNKQKRCSPRQPTNKSLNQTKNHEKRWQVLRSAVKEGVGNSFLHLSHIIALVLPDTKAKAVKANKTEAKKTSTKKGKGNKEDVIAVIRDYLYEMYDANVREVTEDQLLLITGYARGDSKGFRIPVKILIHELKHVEKKDRKIFKLTAEGVRFMEANGGSSGSAKAVSNEEHHDKLKEKIGKLDSKAPMNKLDAIWQVLVDGKSHEQEELLESAGYKRPDSKGYAVIMKWLRKLELVTKEGTTYQFTDKVFPFGSPK
jgi:hypothetical protein